MKDKITFFRELMAAFREIALIALVVMLLFFPSVIQDALLKLGVGHIDFAGIKINLKENVNMGEEVEQMRLQAENISAVLDSVENSPGNAVNQPLLDSLKVKTEALKQTADGVDHKLKQNIIQQQAVLEKGGVKDRAETGWIFGGKVTEDKLRWADRKSKVNAERPVFNAGEIIRTTDDVYLRAGQDGNHAKADVLGVIKSGEKIKILDKDYSHALGGGWFIWLKVEKQTGD